MPELWNVTLVAMSRRRWWTLCSVTVKDTHRRSVSAEWLQWRLALLQSMAARGCDGCSSCRCTTEWKTLFLTAAKMHASPFWVSKSGISVRVPWHRRPVCQRLRLPGYCCKVLTRNVSWASPLRSNSVSSRGWFFSSSCCWCLASEALASRSRLSSSMYLFQLCALLVHRYYMPRHLCCSITDDQDLSGCSTGRPYCCSCRLQGLSFVDRSASAMCGDGGHMRKSCCKKQQGIAWIQSEIAFNPWYPASGVQRGNAGQGRVSCPGDPYRVYKLGIAGIGRFGSGVKETDRRNRWKKPCKYQLVWAEIGIPGRSASSMWMHFTADRRSHPKRRART